MATPTLDELQRALPPSAFPPDEYRVDPVEQFLLSIAMRSEAKRVSGRGSGQRAHALTPFLASMRAMGMPLQEVFNRAGAEDSAPPLHGSVATRWNQPVVVGQTYGTQTELLNLRRTSSTSLGTIDIMTLRTELREEGGAVTAIVDNVMLIPRRESASR